jgi:hypothetical protein
MGTSSVIYSNAKTKKECTRLRTPSFRIRIAVLSLFFLIVCPVAFSQDLPAVGKRGTLDLAVWAAGETGEENTNSFAESQIWCAGVSAGWILTGQHFRGWRRGSLEYAFDLMPVFETYGNQRIHGGGFDPVILRWNSAVHNSRVSPYVELSGGTVITSANLPPGNTSTFNFMAKGGGGIYFKTRNRESFDMGLRWSHISNANLGVINTEFNGVQLSLAYHWYK